MTPARSRGASRSAALRAPAVVLTVAACLGIAPACVKKPRPIDPCLGEAISSMEYRKQAGELLAVVRAFPADPGHPETPPPPGEPVCDGRHQLLGILSRETTPPALVLKSAAGATLITARPATATEEATITAGPSSYRLHDEKGLLRILDGQGVPAGQIARDPAGAGAVIYAPSGRPIATADHTGDRHALHAPDGAVTHFLLGVRDTRAAAVFAVDPLPLPVRIVLARLLDSRP